MNRWLLTILGCVLGLSLQAQTVSQIKADPAYIWAEGNGTAKSQADAAALEALSFRLAATDILDVEPSRRLAVWQTYLQDLKECSTRLDVSSTACLRYIAWNDIPSVFSDRWRKVRELILSAENALAHGAKDEARTYCHWAEIYLASLPEGDSSLRSRVSQLGQSLGSGNTSAVRMRNIESETATISRALHLSGTKSEVAVRKTAEAEPRSTPVEQPVPRKVYALPSYVLLTPISLPVVTGALIPPLSVSREATPAQEKPSYQWKTLAFAEIGRMPAFGLQAVWLPGRFGAYLSARSNFNFTRAAYSCQSDGTTEFGYLWPSGKSRGRRIAASAGVVFRVIPAVDIYAGAGYGQETLLWEDTSGSWASVADLSPQGALAELGVFLNFNHLCLGVGVSTTAFTQACAQIGLGLSF